MHYRIDLVKSMHNKYEDLHYKNYGILTFNVYRIALFCYDLSIFYPTRDNRLETAL